VRDAGTKSIPLARLHDAPRPELEPKKGLRLGRYELLVPLARGGMAEVWIAELRGGLGFSRTVALKLIRPEYALDPSFRDSFLDEAWVAARLRHTNALEVLELGEEGPLLFQAMSLVEGASVAELVRARAAATGVADVEPLPIAITTRILADLLAGLHAAHELTDDSGVPLGLVHRDVTPHNILVGVDGVTKLGDFGVAKFLGRRTFETDAGQLRGKPGYMSPEQRARGTLDRRSDLFAVGVVLWELFVGRRLFIGDEPRTRREVPDPRTLRPELPSALVDVLLRALAPDPYDRWSDAREMLDALEAAARDAGVLGTATDVAAIVTALAGAKIDAQRASVRRALDGPKLAVELRQSLLSLAGAPERGTAPMPAVRPIERLEDEPSTAVASPERLAPPGDAPPDGLHEEVTLEAASAPAREAPAREAPAGEAPGLEATAERAHALRFYGALALGAALFGAALAWFVTGRPAPTPGAATPAVTTPVEVRLEVRGRDADDAAPRGDVAAPAREAAPSRGPAPTKASGPKPKYTNPYTPRE
jgi:hypothetical protein